MANMNISGLGQSNKGSLVKSAILLQDSNQKESIALDFGFKKESKQYNYKSEIYGNHTSNIENKYFSEVLYDCFGSFIVEDANNETSVDLNKNVQLDTTHSEKKNLVVKHSSVVLALVVALCAIYVISAELLIPATIILGLIYCGAVFYKKLIPLVKDVLVNEGYNSSSREAVQIFLKISTVVITLSAIALSIVAPFSGVALVFLASVTLIFKTAYGAANAIGSNNHHCHEDDNSVNKDHNSVQKQSLTKKVLIASGAGIVGLAAIYTLLPSVVLLGIPLTIIANLVLLSIVTFLVLHHVFAHNHSKYQKLKLFFIAVFSIAIAAFSSFFEDIKKIYIGFVNIVRIRGALPGDSTNKFKQAIVLIGITASVFSLIMFTQLGLPIIGIIFIGLILLKKNHESFNINDKYSEIPEHKIQEYKTRNLYKKKLSLTIAALFVVGLSALLIAGIINIGFISALLLLMKIYDEIYKKEEDSAILSKHHKEINQKKADESHSKTSSEISAISEIDEHEHEHGHEHEHDDHHMTM